MSFDDEHVAIGQVEIEVFMMRTTPLVRVDDRTTTTAMKSKLDRQIDRAARDRP